MTITKLMRRVAIAAFLFLGMTRDPSDPSNRVGLYGGSRGVLWVVYASETTSDDKEWVEEDKTKGSSKGPKGERAPEDVTGENAGGKDTRKQTPAALRGAVMPGGAQKKELEGIFKNLMKSMGASADDFIPEDTEELSELIDRVFVPRLQSTPRFQGALECLNEAIYKDILATSKTVKHSTALLQKAYSYTRKPPRMLEVPELFVELRDAADRYQWDDYRRMEKRRYERRGYTVPGFLLLTADEFTAQDAEEPRVRDEELTQEDISSRTRMIDGWLKQQFRLRLYYGKRIGTLDGDPQDFLVNFDAGPICIDVSVEDIEGLSFNAELDPEPSVNESETTGGGLSKEL